MNAIKQIWEYRHLIYFKAYADFQTESRSNILGPLWWILDPIINTFIYYLVFGVFLARGGDDFVPFLIVGIVAWQWFQGSIVTASVSIWKSAPTFRQAALPKIIFPLTRITTALFRHVFALIIAVAVLIFYGYTPELYWGYVLVPLAVQILLLTCISLNTAAVIPFFPDFASLVQYILRIGFYMSGVLYVLTDLPESIQFYLRLNPMVHVINAYRDILLYQLPLDWTLLGMVSIFSVVGIWVGLSMISYFDGIYAKRIQS